MKRKVHILFFCPHLGNGGAEIHLVRLVKALDRDLFRKTIVTSQAGGSYEALLDDVDVEIVSLDVYWKRASLRMIASVPRLARSIRQADPDIVFSIMDYANVFCLLAHRLASHRSIVVVDVQTSMVQSLRFAPQMFNRVVFAMMKRGYSRADKIVCLSAGVAKELQQVLPRTRPSQYAVIHNIGLDAVVESVITHKRKRQICVCGRLMRLKGYDLVIEAVAKLRSRYPDISLVVVGSGPEEHALRRHAEKCGVGPCTFFPGFVANPAAIIAESELLIVSSHYEGFCNVIVEAMALGTPVVSTDCPYGPGEIIQSGRNGVLVPVGDVDALAKAMTEILDNPDLYARIQTAGVERSMDFVPKKIAQDYEELLLGLLPRERIS